MAANPSDVPVNKFPLDNYELLDRYRRESGRVFLTGTQALVRIPLMQRTIDKAAGLNTAGFISGYRGSPLGAYAQELWRATQFLEDNTLEFLPAVNEDLAATAVLGSQQVETDPHRNVDGVFGIWYGKGPGVDRSGDALKHGNAYGSSPHGGVLVVAGNIEAADRCRRGPPVHQPAHARRPQACLDRVPRLGLPAALHHHPLHRDPARRDPRLGP